MISLTIGIPTYNRGLKLKKLLTVIDKQVSKINNPKIELIISNNNSNDNTRGIIEKFAFLSKIKVKIINQEINIGFDANVDSILKSSSGLYTWTLGDDDELKDHAIKDVYDVTQSYDNYKFIFVNYLISLGNEIINSNCQINFLKEVNSVDLLGIIDYSNSFVSSCIFKTSEWNKIDVQPYINSYWVHLFMSREILNEGKSYIIGKPLIIQQEREDYPEVYSGDNLPNNFKIYYNTNRFFFGLKSYKKTSSHNYKSSYFLAKNDIKHIIYYKLTRDRYRFNEIVKMIKLISKYRKFHLINLISLFLLFTPNIIFNSLRKLKKLF